MRFRADAVQSITDAPKRSILLFMSSAGLLQYNKKAISGDLIMPNAYQIP